MLSSRAARLWTGFGLLALVCALGLSRIGWWQLERAQSKQALLDGIEAASHAPLIALSELEVSGADAHFRAVTVEGEFRADRQILLDNQLRAGQPGVRVYVPFQRGGASATILVDRGWLAWPDRSQAPPQVRVPAGMQQLSGVLLDPPGAGMQLGTQVATQWPLLLTRIDLVEIERRLGLPLLDLVLEDRNAPRAQTIRAQMLPPERHRGYALQWGLIALAVIGVALAASARRLPIESGEIVHEQS